MASQADNSHSSATPPGVKRGLVFAKYGDRAASTRQRFVQAMPYLAREGITLEILPLFDNTYLERFFATGKRSVVATAKACLKRLWDLRRAKNYDFVVVQYELFPYLPGFFEALIGLLHKPILYDIDDAMFHQYDAHKNPLIRRLLGKKLLPLLRRVDIALCGNAYLAEYVRPYARRTEIIPTTVDTDHYLPLGTPTNRARPVLGWMGSPTTWNFCKPLNPLFAVCAREGHIDVLIVGAEHAALHDLPFTYRHWVEANEVADIQAMDIGIMPSPDDAWARGKCGYKLIQYMACGLPVIAAPVGVNREIVTHGVNGFLATTEAQWREAIMTLAGDAALRASMGKAGRARVLEHYSIQQVGPRIAQLTRELCNQL